MASASEVSADSQIQIRLFTKQEQYAVPDTPYSIAVVSTTENLNTLVNALIRESRENVENVDFDFIIQKEFLRVSIAEHLQDRSLSTENLVEIEYVQRHPAPKPQDCLMHDDWVASVQACGPWILTGCYDGTVHIWTVQGANKLTIPAHKDPVKAVAWIGINDDVGTFISVAHDQTANIWQWNISSNSVECVVVCKGHERGVESVAVNPDKSKMATGSWDSFLKIWSASIQDMENGESSSKRVKGDLGKVRTPILTLQGHKEAIVSVCWMDNFSLVTASWDHTIKIWDANLGGIKNELAGNKSFFDLDYSNLNQMFITSSADRHIRLYDPRSSEGSVVKNTYTSHDQWVQTVRWSKTNEHLFLSGAYDNQVKLWDTRSPKAPLYDLSGHDDNVLSCDWTNPKYMISAGKDNTVRVYKSKHHIK